MRGNLLAKPLSPFEQTHQRAFSQTYLQASYLCSTGNEMIHHAAVGCYFNTKALRTQHLQQTQIAHSVTTVTMSRTLSVLLSVKRYSWFEHI